MKNNIFTIIILLAFSPVAEAQNNLNTKVIATNLDTPWEIIWGPDDYIWMTERYGRVSRVNPNTGDVSEVIQIEDVEEINEGGLLGMALDPDFSENGYFYVAYNYYADGNDYREKVVRFTYSPTSGKADNQVILFDNIDGANNHNGSRLVISPDKKLIFTTGDATNTSNSQNINSLNGKTLRINLDGTIPEDNPIKDSPVWTWGHRNPQGLIYSPDSTILYSSEHGPSNDDEINIISKGRNYGWPNVQGFCDNANETAFCNDSNVVEPIKAWTPTLAVAGIEFYNSDLISEWKNSLLVTTLKASRIVQLHLDEAGTSVLSSKEYFTNDFGRLRAICISPDGKVYIATSNLDSRGTPNTGDDKIIEITPVSSSVNDTDIGKLINVSPNPVTDYINITLSKSITSNVKYSLNSINGQVIESGILNAQSTKLQIPANYVGFAILHLQTDNQNMTKKIVIKR